MSGVCGIRGLVAGLGALMLVGVFAPLASAQITDRVSFKAGPSLMVWNEAGDLRQGAAVSMTLDAAADFTGLAEAPVMTGTLVTASFSASDTVHQTIRIASNTAFRIEAASQSGWDIDVDLISAGPLAQTPGASTPSQTQLMAGVPLHIFAMSHRTAAQRGAPADQAITLHIRAQRKDGAMSAPLRLNIVTED
ncbi:MAG: hypothetical protein AAF216_11735 [Pseudomonadota bacterium]